MSEKIVKVRFYVGTCYNPADVEALRKAREAIKAAWSDGSANAAMDKASEALTAIDKVIGGKEDV